ncbi:MAG: hypothetical protein ACI4MQ_03125 [Candidatus Coproplasma sp.]
MADNYNDDMQVEDVPLEELRALYLHKGRRRKPVTNNANTSSSGQTNSVPSQTRRVTKEISKVQLVCNILLFASIILVTIMAFIFYATPTVEVGGQVYNGKSQNIFSFLWFDENSVIKQLIQAIDSVKSISSSEATEIVSSSLKMLRLIFLIAPTAYVGLSAIVCVVYSIFCFVKKNSQKLAKNTVWYIVQYLSVYISFVFFGNVSGGNGEDGYYVGYSIGLGLTISILIGLALLIAVSLCLFFANKKEIWADADKKYLWRRAFTLGIIYTAIAIALTFMRIYSVFVYVINSSLSTIILSISSGFHFKSLIFPLLNLTLFVCCMILVRKTTSGFTNSFNYLLNAETEDTKDQQGRKKKKNKLGSIIWVIVVSSISLVCVIMLSIPFFGYGWSVNIYYYLVFIFFASVVGQSVLALLNTKSKQSEKKKA